MKYIRFILCLIISSNFVLAQQNAKQYSVKYDYSKNGVLIFETFRNYENIQKTNPDLCKTHLDKIKNFVEVLVVSSGLLTKKNGFDLNVVANAYGNMDDPNKWKHADYEYGIKTEFCFQFQLFFLKGGKWDQYNPNWCFKINAPLYDKASPFRDMITHSKILNESFLVFPYAKDIAPGVRFHYNDAGHGEIVFFNPNRPAYWLPVTLKEFLNAQLKYFAENEKAVYELFKSEVDKLSEAELNEPAYYGKTDENILLELNGRKIGVPVMRFNADYWDRSLPRSAIQYFTLPYSEIIDKDRWEEERQEFFRNNEGRIDLIVESPLSINEFEKLSGVIQKK